MEPSSSSSARRPALAAGARPTSGAPSALGSFADVLPRFPRRCLCVLALPRGDQKPALPGGPEATSASNASMGPSEAMDSCRLFGGSLEPEASRLAAAGGRSAAMRQTQLTGLPLPPEVLWKVSSRRKVSTSLWPSSRRSRADCARASPEPAPPELRGRCRQGPDGASPPELRGRGPWMEPGGAEDLPQLARALAGARGESWRLLISRSGPSMLQPIGSWADELLGAPAWPNPGCRPGPVFGVAPGDEEGRRTDGRAPATVVSLRVPLNRPCDAGRLAEEGAAGGRRESVGK
mmetsp:Transcript_112118/g.350477  ORF Transcript_112118/g.350477 Transcript_112118/m.350477 type:complete len:292 (+) Transcript_112118:176-1051(+)